MTAPSLPGARALDLKYRGGLCDVYNRTNTPGSAGGNRTSYPSATYANESCRIVADRSASEVQIGGVATSVVLYTIHLRHDFPLSANQQIVSGDATYQVIGDASDPTNRYATLARCRKLS